MQVNARMQGNAGMHECGSAGSPARSGHFCIRAFVHLCISSENIAPTMRVLGVDLGRRRVGLAISDPTGMLARPLATLTVRSAADALEQVVAHVERLAAEDD